MTENKPITNIIFDNLNQRIKNIGEKCINFQKENKNLKEQLTRKTQECEELKERLNSRCFDPKSNNNRCISYNRIAEDYERDLKQIDQLKTTKEQAEQKLKRIKEVAKQMNNECFYNDFDCKDCDMKNGCTYFNKSKILQIIDEVE